MSNEPGTVHLPARDIPIPETISAEAQAFLANPMFSNEQNTPALDDIEGWRAHCARTNAGLTAMMRMQRQGSETTNPDGNGY